MSGLLILSSQVFIVKAVKVGAKVADRIFSIAVICKIRLVHVEFFSADKAGFDFFFHAKTLKKRK